MFLRKKGVDRQGTASYFFAQSAGRKDAETVGLWLKKEDQSLWFSVVFFLAIRKTNGDLAAHVAQLAERVLGKDEVTSSILVMGSSIPNAEFRMQNSELKTERKIKIRIPKRDSNRNSNSRR